MRARMAIHVAGITVNIIEVALKNKPQSLIEYSPKGTVPVVVTTKHEVIEESRDIMLWALHQCDPEDWLFKDDSEKYDEMMQFTNYCDSQFKPWLDRYKYADRYPEHTEEYYRQQGEAFLQQLDARLATHSFLMDEHIRFVDVAIFPFIRQFAGVDAVWFSSSPYPHLQRWLNTCVNTDMFNAVMNKAWQH